MLILSRRDVLDLLTLPDCIEAVERAFGLHAEGRTLGPGVLGVPAEGGGFHIKAAGLVGERRYFAAKINANFPENPRRHGLPSIRGTVMRPYSIPLCTIFTKWPAPEGPTCA